MRYKLTHGDASPHACNETYSIALPNHAARPSWCPGDNTNGCDAEIHNKRKVEKDAAKDKQGPAPAPEAQLQAE